MWVCSASVLRESGEVVGAVPLLILSDSVAGTTGLGRIARELASRIHSDLSDVFRVGVAGVGGNHTSRLPFPNYPIQQLQGMVPCDLNRIWSDFAGSEKGILLVIWNHTWCGWLSNPERLPPGLPLREFLCGSTSRPDNIAAEAWEKLNPKMQRLLSKVDPAPFKKWLYCPVDGDLPDGTMGKDSEPILRGFDRVLSYTRWGARVIERTLAQAPGGIQDLPHGTDTSVFYPRDRAEARKTFVNRLSTGQSQMEIRDDTVLLGCVGTNSYRKDWGLAFETAGELLRRGVNVFMWCHTNALDTVGQQTYWSFLALAYQFGMAQRVVLTTHSISDEDMAWCFSALDCYIANGTGEGWGLTGAESLACGIPVVHGNYAGGTDFVPKKFLVDFDSYRLDGKWMTRRPSFKAEDWADKVEFCLTPEAKALAKLPESIDWRNAWPAWREWLVNGLAAS